MIYTREMKQIDLLVIGELLVDLLPTHRGPLSMTRDLQVHNGGAPANVAAGVSRLGADVAITSLVGNDQFGLLAIARLEEEGVDCTRVHTLDGVQTGLCFITLDQDGERTFTHRGGDPFSTLSSAALDEDALRRARCIEFSCAALRSEKSTAAIRRAIELTDGLVAFDPGCPPAWGTLRLLGNEVSTSCGTVMSSNARWKKPKRS